MARPGRDLNVTVAVERSTGADVERHMGALAQLRIEVFREYPYLYDGSLAYEREYMREFARSPRSTLVIARDGEEVVGVSTATPLLEHSHGEPCAEALQRVGIAPERVYYFGESVLRASHRGRGIGNAFFAERERSARAFGFGVTSFCAVVRPDDHPLRPVGYVPHDAFWTRRGYRRLDEAVANFTWRDVGEREDTSKPMVFWIKELGG